MKVRKSISTLEIELTGWSILTTLTYYLLEQKEQLRLLLLPSQTGETSRPHSYGTQLGKTRNKPDLFCLNKPIGNLLSDSFEQSIAVIRFFLFSAINLHLVSFQYINISSIGSLTRNTATSNSRNSRSSYSIQQQQQLFVKGLLMNWAEN